jgi:proline dehydrogenase
MKHTKAPKVRNITELTMAQHKFEGYVVRISRHNLQFRKYTAARIQGYDAAYAEAVALLDKLKMLLKAPATWIGTELQDSVVRRLSRLGVTVSAVK